MGERRSRTVNPVVSLNSWTVLLGGRSSSRIEKGRLCSYLPAFWRGDPRGLSNRWVDIRSAPTLTDVAHTASGGSPYQTRRVPLE